MKRLIVCGGGGLANGKSLRLRIEAEIINFRDLARSMDEVQVDHFSRIPPAEPGYSTFLLQSRELLQNEATSFSASAGWEAPFMCTPRKEEIAIIGFTSSLPGIVSDPVPIVRLVSDDTSRPPTK